MVELSLPTIPQKFPAISAEKNVPEDIARHKICWLRNLLLFHRPASILFRYLLAHLCSSVRDGALQAQVPAADMLDPRCRYTVQPSSWLDLLRLARCRRRRR